MNQRMPSRFGRLAWQNECTGWMAMGRARQAGSMFLVEQRAGLVCVWLQGSSVSAENHLLVFPDQEGDPRQILAEVMPVVMDSRLPTVLRWLDIPGQQKWEAAAKEHDFSHTGEDPVMVCDLHQYQPNVQYVPGVSVTPVKTQEDYQAAFEVIHEVYGGPRQLTQFFNPFGTVQIFLARWQSMPAASATLWPFAGVAGVYSVATRPVYRRHGLALTVLNVLLSAAKEQGYSHACLRTAAALFPLYERCGFHEVGRVFRYTRLPGVDKSRR